MVALWCCSFYTFTAVFPAGDWIFNFLLLFWFDNVCHLVSSTKVLDISLYFLGLVFLKIQKKNRARAVCGKKGGERSVELVDGQVVTVFHSDEFSFSFRI